MPRLLATVLMLTTLLTYFPPDLSRLVTVSNITPAEGASYIATLSDPALGDNTKPTGAELYLIESRRGAFLHRLDNWCVAEYVCSWLNALFDANFPHASYEVRRPLGPGQSPHNNIRELGGGRYSVWGGALYFSLPPDVPSLLSVRRLDVWVPSVWQPRIAGLISWLQLLSAIGLAASLVLATIGSSFTSFLRRNVLPGLVISVASLAALAASAEFYFRHVQMFPVRENKYPRIFVDQVGFTFPPGSTIKWTNGIDFWTVDQANSLGFLDAEPTLPKPPGTFRILLVGDSFVEAAQVPLSQKLQTLLTSGLRDKYPGRKVDTVAFGFSGTGQSNQLRYYERSRSELKPDVVILLYVNNDFTNNSHLLESLRQGWHPDHVPWLYFSEKCERAPISPDWQQYLVPGASVAARARELRTISSEMARALDGWTVDNVTELDAMFDKRSPLPPVFEDAIASTKCALAEWRRLADQDGFKLVVVATETVSWNGGVQIDRLRSILGDLRIPLLDLGPAFNRHNKPAEARWQADLHWSPVGHRWAADAILDYLISLQPWRDRASPSPGQLKGSP